MTNHYLSGDGFHLLERVQTHPATNAWMQGDRYGNITKIGTKWFHVQMDKSGRVRKFRSTDLLPVENDDPR